mmetsp:Transcript_12096/g.24348  ORF Transcript_12096/g.24348 Transcript_12096/m.24348 type:complete len:103 (-) Transcript_12096:221-529(-)
MCECGMRIARKQKKNNPVASTNTQAGGAAVAQRGQHPPTHTPHAHTSARRVSDAKAARLAVSLRRSSCHQHNDAKPMHATPERALLRTGIRFHGAASGFAAP